MLGATLRRRTALRGAERKVDEAGVLNRFYDRSNDCVVSLTIRRQQDLITGVHLQLFPQVLAYTAARNRVATHAAATFASGHHDLNGACFDLHTLRRRRAAIQDNAGKNNGRGFAPFQRGT